MPRAATATGAVGRDFGTRLDSMQEGYPRMPPGGNPQGEAGLDLPVLFGTRSIRSEGGRVAWVVDPDASDYE
jgi:hypothetical protein